MKKYFVYVFIAMLSASASVFLVKHYSNESNQGLMVQDESLNYHLAKFSPEEAVKGPDFRMAAQKSVDAVVHIRSEFERKSAAYDDFFGSLRDLIEGNQRGHAPRSQPYTGYGSGVIISSEGYIVTNNHVVEGATQIEVTLNDKQLYEAELIGRDPTTDLALIKIDASSLPYLDYGDSDEVMVGEWVLAVGNPFNLTSTVTAGIVSAKARDINILGSNTAIESFIQTDAVVNRGNSGGALVNDKGELVGINAAIASHTGIYEGYSFAIPINIVKKVVADFREYGSIQRAYMGITIRELNADLAKEMGINDLDGVYINSIADGGGAEKAGIESKDIITAIDGMRINSTSELLETLGQHRPGDQINVQVSRRDRKLEFEVILQNENGTTSVNDREKSFTIERLGAKFVEIPEDEKMSLNLRYGLKIEELYDGIFKNGGVREGFIVLKINDTRINSKQDLDYAMSRAGSDFLKVTGIYPNGMRIIYGFE